MDDSLNFYKDKTRYIKISSFYFFTYIFFGILLFPYYFYNGFRKGGIEYFIWSMQNEYFFRSLLMIIILVIILLIYSVFKSKLKLINKFFDTNSYLGVLAVMFVI